MNHRSLLSRIFPRPFAGLFPWILCFSLPAHAEPGVFRSDWIDPARIMVIYNTVKMDSVDPAEADTFSHDMGEWYMLRYGMPTNHLVGFNLGVRVKWDNPGAYDFLRAVADYIETNRIQIVLLAPGTPLMVRDTLNHADLALDSLAGHALWFAHIKREAPACRDPNSIEPDTCNLYFPYFNMGDGASPFVGLTADATRWCPGGGDLIGSRKWFESRMMDLRDHPSVRPFGRIGLPFYLEAFPSKDKDGNPIPELQIPLENSQFVKDLVNGGIAATTSVAEFNAQTNRCLLFFGRENNTASFIDVESALCEAMAQDAILQGVATSRLVRVSPTGGSWDKHSCLIQPAWDYAGEQFMKGRISPGLCPLIFSAGGVNNTTEDSAPWPDSLDVRSGLVASVSVSNGKAFAGSLMRRGATTIVVNLHHPQDSRLHAWFSVFRQLVNGATVAEALIAGGGAERGGYISGSIWGDPLYAPFGKNPQKEEWFTGGRIPPSPPATLICTRSGSRINLSWAPAHLAAGYRVERSVNGGVFEEIAMLPVPTRDFSDMRTLPEDAIEYRVFSYNTAGKSQAAQGVVPPRRAP